MTAREVLALAWVAFGLALAASELRKDLAVPLLIGAIALLGLALSAFIRRTLLVEDAAVDRDACALDAVRRYAARLATCERRRDDADSIRRLLARPELAIAPVSAVALDRLLLRPEESALYNEELPPECVRSRLVQIEAGFRA